MRRWLVLIASLSLLAQAATATLAGSAAAAGLPAPVADCDAHGRLTRSYTAAELTYALNHIPADLNEYTVCYDVISRARLAKIGKLKGSGDGGSGGSFLPAWLLVVIGVLVVGGGGFGVAAGLRRRGAG